MKKTLTLLAIFSGLYATAQTEATFYTTKGSFTVELYDTIAPVTVDSFMARVNEKSPCSDCAGAPNPVPVFIDAAGDIHFN